MTVEGAPHSFSAAGVRMKDIIRIPMVIKHRHWPWPADSICLFGRDLQANRYGAQVFIEVYPLPAGAEKFEEDLALYQRHKKGCWVEGRKFDQSLLLPRQVSESLEIGKR